MATVGKIVQRALRLIRAIDVQEVPTGDEFETAIEALNSMMARWEADGTTTGWAPVSNPSETMPTSVELDGCIAYNLAAEIAPEYGVPLSPEVASKAAELYQSLLRDVFASSPILQKVALPLAEGGYWPSSGGLYGPRW